MSEEVRQPRILPTRSTELVETPTVEQYREAMEARPRLNRHHWALVARQVFYELYARAMMDKGALLTFLTILTFVPTVLGAYSIATLILANDSDWTRQLVTQLISDYVPEEAAETVTAMVLSIISQTAEQTWLLVLSIVVALFSSSGYVRAFCRSANSLYGRAEGRHPVVTILQMWGLTAVLIVGMVLLAATLLLNQSVIMGVLEPIAEPFGIESQVAWLAGVAMPVWRWIRYPVALFIGIFMITLLFNYSPNVRYPRFRVLTVGSSFTVVCGGLIYYGYSLYLRLLTGFTTTTLISLGIALLIAMWIFNIALMIGVKIDVEITRARELAAGLASHKHVLVPPRGDQAAIDTHETEQDLIKRGRQSTDV